MGKRGVSKRRLEMGEEKWAEHKRKMRVEKVMSYRRRIKLRLIDYKGGSCQICGYNKRVGSAYAFHHLDPNEKDFQLSDGYCKGIKSMLKEIKKCQLLCVRCHAEIHDQS